MKANSTKIKGRAASPDTIVDLSKVRAYAACRSCRTKKIKCLPGPSQSATSFDASTAAAQPGPCQQCLQAGGDCTYPPTRDRAAYSRQYVQNLEGRVQALEMMQGRLTPLLEAFENGSSVEPHLLEHEPRGGSRPQDLGITYMPEPGQAAGRLDSTSEISPQDHLRHSISSPHEPPSDMEDDAGQMTQDERGNYRWIGSSNTLSLLHSFSHNRSPNEPEPPTTVDPGNNPYFGPVAGAGVVKALPGVDEVSYPTQEKADEMVDAFFTEVHPVLPVVEESRFREGYRCLMLNKDTAHPDPHEAPGFISVLFAIFALGERVLVSSRAWQRERTKGQDVKVEKGEETVLPGEAEAGVIWYERAQILHYTTLKDVTIHQVQCLTLLAAFQASVNAMPMSWLLAGQAIRVAQDLGLHRSTARLRLSFAEKQIRSRCWWAIYGLERFVSVTLGRPLGVDDLDVDVALPAPISDDTLAKLPKDRVEHPDFGEEPHDSTMSGFIALTKLCKIAGRVAQVLYRPLNGRSVSDAGWAMSQQNTINKLDRTLKDWLENDVPSKYKDPSTTARPVQLVSAVLSNAYFAVLLTLHRNFLPSNPDYPRPRPPSNSQSLSHLVEAARAVIHVAANQRVLLPPSHHLAAACHNLWSSAIILLLCEVQARDQIVIDAVGSSVESCRQSLRALEPAWPGSRKLKELLTDVEIRTKEVAANGPPQSKKRKSSQDRVGIAKRSSSNSRMPPPNTASPHQNPWHNLAAPRPSTPNRARAYETSDTRTIVRDDELSNSSSFHSQTHSGTFTTPPTGAQNNFNFDTSQLFDIGGVTFDGLEMLQGFDFTTADATSFWNSFVSPTAANNYVMSGHSTPNSGQGSGPSPNNNWQVGGEHASGGMGGTGTATANPATTHGGGTDFWSQVAPSGYDWAADPNVPFNI